MTFWSGGRLRCECRGSQWGRCFGLGCDQWVIAKHRGYHGIVFFTSKFVLTVFLRTLFCSDRLPSPHFQSDWDFRLLLQVVSDCWRRMVSSMTCPNDFEKLLHWLSIFEKTRFKFKGTLFWGKDAHVQRLKMFHRVGAVTQPSWFHGGKNNRVTLCFFVTNFHVCEFSRIW